MSRPARVLLAGLSLCALAACGSTVSVSGLGAGTTGGGSDLSSLGVGAQPTTATQAGGTDLPTASAPIPSHGTGSAPTDATEEASTTSSPSLGVPGARSTPLTIGVVYTTNQSQIDSSLGADNTGSQVDYESVAKAMVNGLNALGGLLGHRLVPVYYGQNPQASDFASDAQAACALFTQDHHVPVVLDLAFGTLGGFQSCLHKAGVLDITSSYEPDAITSHQDAIHANTSFMTVDRTYVAALTGLTGTGYLSAKSQVGVLIENCAANESAYNHSVAPLIASLGLKRPILSELSCVTSYSGIAGAASQIAQAELKFHSQGVDRVMLLSTNEVVALLLFSESAQSQGYFPGYVLTSNGQVGFARKSLPKGQQPQLHGVGIYPSLDTEDATSRSPAERRCFAISAKAGVSVAKYPDYGTLYSSCAPFLLLEAAIKGVSGAITTTSLTAAIARLGTSYSDPGMVAGASRFSSTQHDGPAKVRVFSYVASCTCIRYVGPAMEAP